MLNKEKVKSIIKQSSLYARYCPNFGRPNHGEDIHEGWLIDRIDDVISSGCGEDDVAAIAGEMFGGSGFLGDILNLAGGDMILWVKASPVGEVPAMTRKDNARQQTESAMTREDFENTIKQTPCRKLNSFQWKDLSLLACRYGFQRAGYFFRMKAIEYLYDKGIGNRNMRETCDLFTAAMELGDFETARHIIDKRLNGWKRKFICAGNAKTFYDLYNDFEACLQMVRQQFTPDDKLFAEYIKGKRVAIVGPALTEAKNGAEIDTFDIIVRITYQGKEHIPADTAGSRTNISYCSSWKGRELMSMADKEFLNDLDYAVHKDSRNRISFGNLKERSVAGCPVLVFSGTLNMIPIAVLDLLMFDVKEIKVFNTNFFIAGEPYAKGYTAQIDDPVLEGKNSLLKIIAAHDQLTQINLIRNLWKKGYFNADDELEGILSMSNEEIMGKLEMHHWYTWPNSIQL